MPSATEQERERLVAGICASVRRIGQHREWMTPVQRVVISEVMRDTADEIDHGEGDQLRHVARSSRRSRY
jgi:hypothetical protein